MNIYRTRYVIEPKARVYIPTEQLARAIALYHQTLQPHPEPALSLAVRLVRQVDKK